MPTFFRASALLPGARNADDIPAILAEGPIGLVGGHQRGQQRRFSGSGYTGQDGQIPAHAERVDGRFLRLAVFLLRLEVEAGLRDVTGDGRRV